MMSPILIHALLALAPTSESAAPEDESARLAEIETRLDALERENALLRARLEAEGEQAEPRDAMMARPSARLGGYVDAGFFVAAGNGTGFRRDLGNAAFPELDAIPGSWVLLGDPLSTAMNSRGEPADLSMSRAMRTDLVHAGSRPSFIANAIQLQPQATLGERFQVEARVDFLPRTHDPTDPTTPGFGDYVDVKVASMRYMVPARRYDLDIYAGKIDSVVGVEYQRQESPDRLTVTPSFGCRYTCGRAIGVSSRWGFLNRALSLNVALTNGSNVKELFGFHDETDSNAFKTASGRLSYALPIPIHLRVGASGAFGAQDLQTRDDVYQWQYGFDLQLRWRDLELVGEYVFVTAQGETSEGGVACDLAACLESTAIYGQIAYRVLNWLVPYFRTDWRDATHRHGTEFAYVTDGLRLTPGINFPVTEYATVKVEYNVNLELRRIPSFPNDVFTSSVVGYF